MKGGIEKMKYLKIVLVGHEPIYANENTKKENGKQPDFRSDGVAVWVNVKKEELGPTASARE